MCLTSSSFTRLVMYSYYVFVHVCVTRDFAKHPEKTCRPQSAFQTSAGSMGCYQEHIIGKDGNDYHPYLLCTPGAINVATQKLMSFFQAD